MRANVLLVGLDETLGAELSRALAELRHAVVSEAFLSAGECVGTIDLVGADLVFCTAEASAYESLLEGLRSRGRDVPVVVVSRLPEVEKWLDAMDAGACDYCASPFEPRLIRSIIDHTLKYPRALAAAC
jgi:DNA-binding NtrC family response regulator